MLIVVGWLQTIEVMRDNMVKVLDRDGKLVELEDKSSASQPTCACSDSYIRQAICVRLRPDSSKHRTSCTTECGGRT